MRVCIYKGERTNDVYVSWWQNFDDYHESIWTGDYPWVDYVNDIIEDIGHFYWPKGYIEFNSEEDYINFVLIWS